MADDELENFLEQEVRKVSITLRPSGGRVFANHAEPNGIDRCSIELKCWWSPSLMAMFDSGIRIGEDKHKPLTWDDDGQQVMDEDSKEEEIGWSLIDCPIMVSIYRTDEVQLAEGAAKNDGEPILGRLAYYAPIQSSDGVVNDKRPTVTVWVGFGPKNFALLQERLLEKEEPDFDLGIGVAFPKGTVESGWVGKKVNWDGKDVLPVTSAVIVWKRADWDSDADRFRPVRRRAQPEEYEPPREHIELMDAVKRLEANIVKLATPLWIATIAAVMAFWLSR